MFDQSSNWVAPTCKVILFKNLLYFYLIYHIFIHHIWSVPTWFLFNIFVFYLICQHLILSIKCKIRIVLASRLLYNSLNEKKTLDCVFKKSEKSFDTIGREFIQKRKKLHIFHATFGLANYILKWAHFQIHHYFWVFPYSTTK